LIGTQNFEIEEDDGQYGYEIGNVKKKQRGAEVIYEKREMRGKYGH